jgi:hypothetical protein
MANVIKHKRGSGSDPSASDLILGELAIRTDTGKLFTKMDSGAIAEIAGGGSDIAINTLSSSSGTGGGSATFNGSAYRFTLSAPPNVSAAQLLVSINGVIQKPVAGTGQPSEGFSVDGTDIILGDAPATGSDFFILTFKSLGVSEPADNSVTSAKIVDGAIVNADINASAAIQGTKVSPNFGSQNIVTTGNAAIGTTSASLPLTVVGANNTTFDHVGTISLQGTDAYNSGNAGAGINFSGKFNSSNLVTTLAQISGIKEDTGDGTYDGALTFGVRNDAQGVNIERMRIDSSGNVGIGTTSPDGKLDVRGTIFVNGDGTGGRIFASSGNLSLSDGNGRQVLRIDDPGTGNSHSHIFDSNGRLGIGTTTPTTRFTIVQSANNSTGGLSIFDSAASSSFRIFRTGAGAGSVVSLQDRGTDVINIKDQQVGIGTTSPDSILDISSATPLITFNSTDTQLTQDELIGGIKVFKSDASGSGTGIAGSVLCRSADSFGARTYLAFTVRVNSTGQTNTDSEAMRIDENARLLVGTTSANSVSARLVAAVGSVPGYYANPAGLSVTTGNNADANCVEFFQGRYNKRVLTLSHSYNQSVSLAVFEQANVSVGSITGDGSNVSFNESSDYRLKENIVNITDGITRLKQLIPRRFNWIADSTNTLRDGFLAHEVSPIIPEAVTGEKDALEEDGSIDPQQIDYSKLTPLLTAALQESISKIETLETKVAALEAG